MGQGGRWLGIMLCAGCSVLDPGLIARDGGTDTGTDAARDTATTDTGPSGLRKVPARPSTEDGPDVDPYTLALRDVVLNQSGEQWRDIGLDLDDFDTQNPVPEVECIPPNMEATPLLDGNEGIDNAFGDKLFPIVQLALPDLEERTRENHLAGLGTIVLRMSGWNGTRDDPRVDIFLTQSAAGTSADPSSVSFDGFDLVQGGSPAPAPNWDGNDHFFGRDDTFFMGEENQPTIRDDNAYVSDGTVVMRLPDRIEILFFSGPDAGIRVRLTDAIAFGTFNEDFSQLENAIVAGRWSVLDLLESGDNIGICVGSAQRRIVENQLDTIADVRSRPGTGGPGVTCDAISLGVMFTGFRANWAGLGPSLALPNPCASMMDGGVDAGVDGG